MADWTPEPAEQEKPRTRTSHLIELLLWVALVGIVAAVAIPELAGHPIEDRNILSTLFGFMGLPFIIAHMRRASLPWLYSLAGLVLFFALPLAGGAMRGVEKRGPEKELLASMEQFEPATAKLARAARKDRKLLKLILQPAIRRAAERAPDAELIAYNEALFTLVETPAGINRQRCAEIISGATRTPNTSEEEILIAQATARLFRAAAQHPEPHSFDMERSVALRGELLKVADRDGVLDDPARMQAMTRDQQCDFYLRTIKGLRELPLPDRALVVRGNMATPN
jgi:hypothetical protein